MKRQTRLIAPACVLLVFTVCGCESTPNTTRGQSPDHTSAEDSTLQQIQTEREKLLREQLELERQKGELERQKLEQQVAAQRQQAEREREKREELERAERARELAKQATLFSDLDYRRMKGVFVDGHETFGEALLGATHPTGTYGYTDVPAVSLSPSRDSLTARMTVHWRGAFSENPYTTTYSMRLTRQGFDRLEVVRDTAIINIEPAALKSAEAQLRDVFDQR